MDLFPLLRFEDTSCCFLFLTSLELTPTLQWIELALEFLPAICAVFVESEKRIGRNKYLQLYVTLCLFSYHFHHQFCSRLVVGSHTAPDGYTKTNLLKSEM